MGSIDNLFEDKWKNLFNYSVEAIFLLKESKKGVEFVDSNPSGLKLFGCTKEELIGKTPLDFSPPLQEDGTPSIDAYKQIISKTTKGTTNHFEWRHLRKDGSLFDAEIMLTRIPVGNTYQGQAMVRDITEQKKIQKELQESEEKYRNLMESANDAIFIADPKTGMLLDANISAQKLIDRDLDEIKTMSQTDLHPPEHEKKYKEIFKEHIESQRKISGDVFVINRKGEHIPVEISASLFKGHGQLFIQGTFRDLRERKQSEEKLKEINQFSKTIIDSSKEGIAVFDHLFQYKVWNPYMEQLSKLPSSDVIGQSVVAVAEKFHIDGLNKLLKQAISGKTVSVKAVPYLILGKKKGFVEVTYSPHLDSKGDIIGVVGIIRDVSKHIKNKKLLKKSIAKAGEIDSLRDSLLAVISHELRTPLNAILGYIHLIDDDISEKQVHKRCVIHQTYGEKIRHNAEALLSTLNDIIELSAIEAGDYKITDTSFNLNKLLSDLDSQFSLQIAKTDKNIILKKNYSTNVNKMIISSEECIKKIMINLLTNAVKFTDQGTIEYGVQLKDAKTLLFFVKDTGIGISKAQSKKIFKPFYQEDMSDSRKHEGSGLGLTICQQLVRLMKGVIWTENTEPKNGGLTVKFTLPYKKAIDKNKKTTVRKIKKKASKAKEKILLVDDNEDNLFLMHHLLDKLGFDVVCANCGKDAVKEFKKGLSFSLMLIDIQMAPLDGIEAVRLIRSIEQEQKIKRKTPILVMSAVITDEEKEKATKAGCDGYITKPITKESLKEKASKYLSF